MPRPELLEAVMPEPTYVPLQPWRCEKCKVRGDVEMPAGTGHWDGYRRVSDAHRIASPSCHLRWGVEFVRLKNIQLPRGGTQS
jgi:hypothetical protein